MKFQKRKGNFQDWLTTVQDTAGNDNRDLVSPHTHMTRDIQTAQKVNASVRLLERRRMVLGSGATARFRSSHPEAQILCLRLRNET